MAEDWPMHDVLLPQCEAHHACIMITVEKALFHGTLAGAGSAQRSECHLWWQMRRRRRRRKNHRKVTTGEGLLQRLVCETGF